MHLRGRGAWKRHLRRGQPCLQRGSIMTTRTSLIVGLSAAAFSFNLVLAPLALAEDKMGKDDAMKKETMSHDSMKKDTMGKDSMKKDDAMSKDGMMKKDEGMKKK